MTDWTVQTKWTGTKVTIGVLRELVAIAEGNRGVTITDDTEVRVSVEESTREPGSVRTVTLAVQGVLLPAKPEKPPVPYFPPGVRGVHG